MHTHSANSRWVQWKYFGHRLLTKIPAKNGPQNGRVHLSNDALQGTIRNQEFHYTSIHHDTGSSQNIPGHRSSASPHRRHRRSEATLDIRTFNFSQLRPKKAMHYANPELRSTRSHGQHRRHAGHPKHRKGRSDPVWRQKPRYHLWANSPMITKNQEESMDKERNRGKVPPWSSRAISWQVYRHTGQALGSHQSG